jgi:NAD(P)-dependent dehydrogenase (short-subunit alcohol dehydrogenase family)
VNVAGSRVLVAGGSHRVGRVVALHLARAGAHVGISYHRSREAAEETAAEIAELGVRTSVAQADAAQPEQMRALVEQAAAELGGLDVYVYAPSGGFEPRPAIEIDEPLWDMTFDSTAKGFMFGAQDAYRVMREQRRGVIIAITDVAGLQPWPRFAAHAAAKAAQIHLVKCLAADWGPDGIRVCGVAPGPVLMPAGVKGNPEETALRRLGDPADVAQAVSYCIEAEFFTGQELIVDGGRVLRP